MKRIKGERATLSLTQENLANMFNVDVRTIRRWEKGENDIPVSVICKMADLFNVSTDYLLERTDVRKY